MELMQHTEKLQLKEGIKNISDKIEFQSKFQDYDIRPCEKQEVEALTSSELKDNIGYGGFSVVKLIFHTVQKTHYAMKVVNYYLYRLI